MVCPLSTRRPSKGWMLRMQHTQCCLSRAHQLKVCQSLTRFAGLDETMLRASATRCTAVELQLIWSATLYME